VGIVFNHGKQHCIIHDHFKLPGPHWSELAKHDVLGDTLAIIKFTASRCVKEDFNGFFEGATH
jgi:hypothetical protein